MSILIFSESYDNSTNCVVEYLNQFNVPYVRVNTNLNYDNVYAVNIQNRGIGLKFNLRGQLYSIDDFDLIWARRGFFEFHHLNLKNKFKYSEMENPVTQEGIQFLKNYVRATKSYLQEKNADLPITTENFVFGTMQTNYNDLQTNLKDYDEHIKNLYNTHKISNLKKKKQQYQALIAISTKQLELIKQELTNAEDKYKAAKILYKKGVIAKMDFYTEETIFRQKQIDVENAKKTTANQQITLLNLVQELSDLEFQYHEKERTLVNNIYANLLELENGIEN